MSKDVFVFELLLQVFPKASKVLDIRLEQARQLYNACLSELTRRLKLMRQSKEWEPSKRKSFLNGIIDVGVE